MKSGYITRIQNNKRHGESPAMPQHCSRNAIFTAPRLCSVFGGTRKDQCTMNFWKVAKQSKDLCTEHNWSVWTVQSKKNGHKRRPDTSQSFSTMIMLGHMLKGQSKIISIMSDGKSYPTRHTAQTWRHLTTTCFDRCRMRLPEYSSLQLTKSKIGSLSS